MTENIELILVGLAATIALFALQPRWDTGGGALLIFSLGIFALPVILPGMVLICGAYLIWMVIGYPLWSLTRWLWRMAS